MVSMEEGARAAGLLFARRGELAADVLKRVLAGYPSAGANLGEAAWAACARDIGFHLDYLTQALHFAEEGIFVSYAEWLARLFAGLDLPSDCASLSLSALRASLVSLLPGADSAPALSFVDAAAGALSGAGWARKLGEAAPLGAEAAAYLEALLAGDRSRAGAQIARLVEGGASIKSLYLDIFQATQLEIGRLWLAGELSVGQEHFCTAATQMVMSGLYPRVFAASRKGRTMVASGVGGELHELGIRMVADFFELEGWDSHYLGTNLPPGDILSFAEARRAELLCLSVTMAGNLPLLEETIDLARSGRIGRVPKILVGGGVLNALPLLWRRLGADGYAPDAQGALDEASALFPPRARP